MHSWVFRQPCYFFHVSAAVVFFCTAACRHFWSGLQSSFAARVCASVCVTSQVEVNYDDRVKISQICSELNVDGIRGDIVTNRAAKALAAFEGRTQVTPEDIYRVIPLCLRHRLRKDPMADIDSGDKVREVFKTVFGME